VKEFVVSATVVSATVVSATVVSATVAPVVNICLTFEGYKNFNRARKSRSCFINTVLRVPSTLLA